MLDIGENGSIESRASQRFKSWNKLRSGSSSSLKNNNSEKSQFGISVSVVESKKSLGAGETISCIEEFSGKFSTMTLRKRKLLLFGDLAIFH
jgi:hypothetical protein